MLVHTLTNVIEMDVRPIYKAAFHGRPTLIELLARAGESATAYFQS